MQGAVAPLRQEELVTVHAHTHALHKSVLLSLTVPSWSLEVSSAFHSLDKNGDGTLSESELHEALARFHVPVSQLQMQRMMQHFDEDGNGMVSYPEFSEGLRKLMEGKIMASQMGVKASNPLFLVTGDPFAAGKLPHMQQTCVGDTMAQLRADPKRCTPGGGRAPGPGAAGRAEGGKVRVAPPGSLAAHAR